MTTVLDPITSLRARFYMTRNETDQLVKTLAHEDWVPQSMPDASPVKWHLAHTTWFFEEFVLKPHVRDYKPFGDNWGRLFNSYYVGAGERYPRDKRGLITRPTVYEIVRYRLYVTAAVMEHMHTLPAELVVLGINHEQQHQELLLTDVKHLLFQNPLRPSAMPGTLPRNTASRLLPTLWRDQAEGVVTVGASGDGFSFDNEGPSHKAYVNQFALASWLVTNYEYRAFISDGGYRRPELWLAEGFAIAQAQNWTAPLYWDYSLGYWRTFTLKGMAALHDDDPVCHVSFYEADAFARWCGARLPTEQEWESAVQHEEVTGDFLESRHFHPLSQADPKCGARFQQLFGTVWQWTASSYVPYPGFTPAKGTIGEYNGKFMVNQMVLRGGSCATPASHIRPTYRNFFHPDARWQFSGIRLAR